MAEAIAVKEALSWIKQHGISEAIVESDCQGVVCAIGHTVQMNSPFGMIISDCRRLLANLNNATIVFVKRSANKAANYLAKAACSYSGRRSSGGSVPADLNAILMADLLN